MRPGFLQTYLNAFPQIEGWFQFDAALLFMAYCELLRERGIAGSVLEIGVHHGLSSIAVAALRGPGARMYAVDLFEKLQDWNVSASGSGNRTIFMKNMARFYPDTSFLRVIARPSSSLDTNDFEPGLMFCHVDGGHSRQETYSDLRLCASLLAPGGLIALDDYFNPSYPGVSEGAIQYRLKHPGTLHPIAIGYGKVILQRGPAPFDLNAEFARRWPMVERTSVCMWDEPAALIAPGLRNHIDLYASEPGRLKPSGPPATRATFRPGRHDFTAAPGELLTIPVTVANASAETFPFGEGVFGLSYHLLAATGEVLRYDNERAWLGQPLAPGASVEVQLRVAAPDAPGRYIVELDLVWEQVMWFKDVGNPTVSAALEVIQP